VPAKKILVLGDVHLGAHSVEALKEVGKFARAYKPDVLVSLGDLFDCESVSSHDRNPATPTRLVDELASCHPDLDSLLAALPARCERRITLGNHSDRFRRYVWRNAPALDGLIQLDDVFGLKARGFACTPYGQLLKIGKFHFTHDLGKSGAGAARHALQVVQGNILIGHTHRLEVVYEGNPRGKPHVGCSAGWLGDPRRINYRHAALVKKDWMQAYVTIDMDGDGNGLLRQYPLY
jgi:hypothetical protein